MNFPKAIKYALESSGLSMAKLAEYSDMDKSYVSHMVSGRRIPSWEVVQKICETSDISVFEFMTVATSEEIIKLGNEEVRKRFAKAISYT